MSVNTGTSVDLENFLARRMKRKHAVTLVCKEQTFTFALKSDLLKSLHASKSLSVKTQRTLVYPESSSSSSGDFHEQMIV